MEERQGEQADHQGIRCVFENTGKSSGIPCPNPQLELVEMAEKRIAIIEENESSTYSEIIDYQGLTDVNLPPSLSPSLSKCAKAEVKDDFVQKNPLTDPDIGGIDIPTLGAVNSPAIEPEVGAVTTLNARAYGSKDHCRKAPAQKKETVREKSTVPRVKAENCYEHLVPAVHTQYSGRYVGSARLPEGDLLGDKSTATMTDCISTLAKGSKKSNKIIYEFKEDQKVILQLEEREFKLITDEKNAKVILCHPLRKIRAWAVGKETDSRHFAYVIRNPDECAGYSYVCRVFKCSVKAREIATALRNVCQRRAAMRADKNS